MSKEILLFSKSIFEIAGKKQWGKSGFIAYVEYNEDHELDIEKMATEFSEEVKKAFLRFAYEEGTKEKKLSTKFLEIFGKR